MAAKTGGSTAKTTDRAIKPDPAETIDTSGAAQQIVGDVDMSHPAVDDNPRANTTDEQNRIDFNDPTKSGSDAVADNLAAQRD
ncbi:MAG: hypothetical protein OSB00_09725 [Sphingomonas bacterium]|nr:hypothetical protein [Sphingomonas bacterium]